MKRSAKGHEWEASLSNRTLNGSNCPHCTQASSTMELRIFAELQHFFPDAQSRFRIETKELDIYVPSLKTGIEFDGAYWHQKTAIRDRRKNEFFAEQGINVLRVRQTPLPKIGAVDVIVSTDELQKDDVNQIFDAIVTLTGDKTLLPYSEEPSFLREQEYQTYLADIIAARPAQSIVARYPHLNDERDYKKNVPLKPDQFGVGSDFSVWWKCAKGHSWNAVISSRANQRLVGCPYCKRRRPTKTNNLKATQPDIAKEWHESKNCGRSPEQFLPQSSQKVWWRCAKHHDHEWEASISNRVGSGARQGTGCPICFKTAPHKRKPISFDKSVAATHPELARDWHPKKNLGISASDLTPGSNQKVFWRCKRGHVWEATVKNRVNGRGCPDCKWNRKGGRRP